MHKRKKMEPRRRFRFLKQLSEGTFGKVYMSEMITDSNFSKIVAIKILHGKWVEHEEIVQRARDEARVLGLLNHRNIIRVEDLTSIKGKCAVIMEYLDGVDLKSLINYCKENGFPIPLKVILDIIEAVSSAMYAAYNVRPPQGGEALRLIHRDIKPSNIMLTTEGEVKILDFGTAQANFEDREAATVALTFGSAGYMAPERLLLDEKDRPSGDIYSLGVTFYELLTCKRFGKLNPLKEKFEAEVHQRLKMCEADLDRYEIGPDIRAAISGVLRSMLSYEHEDRPDLQETLNQMEQLSTLINDGSLRKFCREIVVSCKEQNKEEKKKTDPLEGTIVLEDSSSTFDKGADISGLDISLPIDIPSKKPITPGVQPTRSATEQPVPEVTQKNTPTSVPEPEETIKTTPTTPPVASSSKKGLLIFGGIFVLAGLGIGGAVLSGVFEGKTGDTGKTQTVATTDTAPPKDTTPESTSTAEFDLGASENQTKVIIKIVSADKIEWLKVKSPRGFKPKFKEKITSQKELVFNNAPAGFYDIKASDSKVNHLIEVPKGKSECTFTLSLDKPESQWSEASWSGCE